MFVALPADWEPMNGKPMKCVKLTPGSAEYKEVQRKFDESHSIHRYTIRKVSVALFDFHSSGLPNIFFKLRSQIQTMVESSNANLTDLL